MKAIQTKFLPCTDYQGSRVKASDADGNSITIGWDHGFNQEQNHIRAARALCEKMSWRGKIATGYLNRRYVHVFVNGETWWATK